MRRVMGLNGAKLLCVALLGLTACSKKPAPAPAPSSSAFKPAAPVASGLPGAPEKVSKTVNPENRPAYAGPAGGVRGVVTVSGDVAPDAREHVQKIKGACPEAREMYAKIFREGMMRSLADALVAVTGYDGYVPAKEPKKVVGARGCAFSSRTLALTFGQTIELVSKDREAYVPSLLGSRQPVQLLALPGGVGSTLYPPEPGHYVLTDSIKVFMLADVFVLKYSTHDVTGLDGRFEINGIPAGKARISALLPATGAVVEKDIEIKPGAPLEVSLEIPFDAKAFAAKSAPPAPSASPSPP